MSRRTVDFGEILDQYITLAVEQGGFETDAEYLRYLVRKDEEQNRKFLLTKAAIQKGIDSGRSPRNRTAEEIVEWASRRLREKNLNKGHG